MTHPIAPAFIRSVARFSNLRPTGPRQAFSQKLTEWVHWTDAGDLAAALDAGAATPPDPRRRPAGVAAATLATAVAGFRRTMTSAIAQDLAATSTTTTRARQQGMESGVAALRGRLREALAATSPDMARLAAIDVVMERVLAPRERSLLAGVPSGLPRQSEGLHDLMLAELDLRLQPVDGLLAALETAQAAQAAQAVQRAQPAKSNPTENATSLP